MTVALAGQLPMPLTTMVGREQELESLQALLDRARLATIVGPGGVGKTRLAIAVGSGAGGAFTGGAWWIELGDLAGAGLVADAILAACEVAEVPGEEPLAALARHFADQRTLLVLDNCEHVADECAHLVQRLLAAAPGLSVLATSREPLGVGGERVFRIGGLSVSGSREAVELFMERAQAADGAFAPDPARVELVARICERLDGLPLAIELAAARSGMLSVEEIAHRLEETDVLLVQANRTAPSRHRTLDDALDWSHAMLSDEEQRLFAILSVFSGSFSLLAAEAVATAAAIERRDVLTLLGALVDKSLVQVADRGAEHRYRLLNTIQSYAAARLAELEERGSVHRAHADFYLGLATQARDGLEGPEQARWLERMELEHDNVRVALDRHMVRSPDVAGLLAAAIWPFWYRRGYYHEARWWLEQAAGAGDAMDPEVAAPVLAAAGTIAFLQCDYTLALERLERARELYSGAGDKLGVAAVLGSLGSIAREQGRYDDAIELHTAASTVWRELDEESGVAACEDMLAFVAWLRGDGETALRHADSALSFFEPRGLRQQTAAALINKAMASHLLGDRPAAAELLSRALAIARELSYLEGVAWAAHELGALTYEEDPSARGLLEESLRTHVALGDRWRTASLVESTAALVLAPTDPERAALLIGAAAGLRAALGAPVPPAEHPVLASTAERLRRKLGAEALECGLASGRATPAERAVELALEALSNGAAGDATAAASPAADLEAYELTDREITVLRLLSGGLTNRQIGAELYISPGTAAIHVSNILRKLGVASRVQAAGVAHQLGLAPGAPRG